MQTHNVCADAQHKTDLQPNGSKANSIEPKELFHELKLCRFCLDRNEKAGEGRIKRPHDLDWNRREEEGWKCVRGREKRVSRCLKTWWKRWEEEMPDSGTGWHEGWDEKIQLKHCFPGLEWPKQLNTEDRLNQLQGSRDFAGFVQYVLWWWLCEGLGI